MNLLKRIAKTRCPHCSKKRLLAGPFYNRTRVRCMNCGAVMKIKEK